MKKALIIHAWGSGPDEHWYREEEQLLKEMGFEVAVPEMPGGTWPKKEEWLKIIKSFRPDKNTILIGHSLGVPAILRYLEIALENVAKVFLIAGFAKDLGFEKTRNFVEGPFNWNVIKKNTKEIYVINETKDPYVPLELGKKIAKNTGGEFIEVEGNIHFDKMDLNLINSRLK